MNPTQKYILRLLLFGAGKTIFNNNSICEVMETHNHLRRLYPLVNADLSEAKTAPFWVHRNATSRHELIVQRRTNGRNHRTLWKPPSYMGESRPETHPDDGIPLVAVDLECRTSAESSGPLGCMLHMKVPAQHVMRAGFHLVGVPTTRRTKKGFLSYESVSKALGKMRTNSVMKYALMEVVYLRQSPTKVARDLYLPLANLKVYASRLRGHVRTLNQG